MSIKFNVALINTCTEAEGPNNRMAIWFQGCDINCLNCCNPELQEIKPAHVMSLDKIVEIAVNSKKENGIEGVTLLGGEPTLQLHLDKLCHEFKKYDLGVILFTGKQYKNLNSKLTKEVDLLVDGAFQHYNIDYHRNLIGSKNQEIHCLTNRYEDQLSWFTETRSKITEINLSENVIITGDPTLVD